MTDNEIIERYKKYEPFFGKWYIKRFIGEGGFAKVFEIVRNDFGDEYTSALKIITVSKTRSEIESMRYEGMTDMEIRDSLRSIVEDTVKEIKLMYKLQDNINIVGYEDHEVIEHEDGWGYDILIKMELLTSLGRYIGKQNGNIAKREVIKLGIDICKALEACQKFNIIHRDIKADNIFVSRNGNFKLGDFGIARIIERKDMDLSKKGTFTYMAPEVYKGQTYTSAVDIYSLGMVMYRLMNNNRAPFLPEYPKPVSLDDRDRALMLRMSGEKFPRPNQAGKGRLAEIVMKACAYRPEERYSSPVAMRQDLDAILYDQDEFTNDEIIMIYDKSRENSTFSGNQGSITGTEGNAGTTENSSESGAAHIPSGLEVTEVLSGEDDVTEVLAGEDGVTEVLSGEDDVTEVLGDDKAAASDVNVLCKECGRTISRDFAICPYCGAVQSDKQDNKKQKEGEIGQSEGKFKKALMIGGISAAVLVIAIIIGVAVNNSSKGDGSSGQEEVALSNETDSTKTADAEVTEKKETTEKDVSEKTADKSEAKEETAKEEETAKTEEIAGNNEQGKAEVQKFLSRQVMYSADGNVFQYDEYGYDKNGNKIDHTCYDSDGSVAYRYEYDENGNELKYITYNSDGSIKSRHENEYDKNGNKLKYTYYNSDGTKGSFSEYEYDKNGNEIKNTSYNSDGSINWRYEYEYDKNGNQIKSTRYNSDGKLLINEYEYDKNGNQIKNTRYNSDGSVDYWQEYEYEYDQYGNEIIRGIENGKFQYYEAKTDKFGNTLYALRYLEDGSVDNGYAWKYEYDKSGNILKATDCDLDGTINYWSEYEYDESGNKLKDTLYDSDGRIERWTEYEYTTTPTTSQLKKSSDAKGSGSGGSDNAKPSGPSTDGSDSGNPSGPPPDSSDGQKPERAPKP